MKLKELKARKSSPRSLELLTSVKSKNQFQRLTLLTPSRSQASPGSLIPFKFKFMQAPDQFNPVSYIL